jgi:hypothetical protein
MRIKLLILSIIASAGFSFAADAVLFGDVLETDTILTPKGVTNAILTTALTVESDPLAYPVATNALAVASTALQADATNGLLRVEADTFATVTARGGTTTKDVTIGSRGAGAVGTASFANGESVVASGDTSHAEGNSTTASGYASHAEGSSTTASGSYSHAEGIGTTASGSGSHAEGFYATASGYYSHAEGVYTTASGEASHAEGGDTTASAYASHAEGESTTASAQASHASGFNAVASHATSFSWQGSDGGFFEQEYGSHGHGTYNLNPVGGLAGLWIGETNMAATLSAYATTGAVAAVQALAEGALQADATNGLLRTEADTLATVTARGSTTTEAVTIGSRGAGAVGTASFANGQSVVASGRYSHAEGIGTLASGRYSHAEGYYTTASEYYSHAEGYYTTASEYYSHASGSKSVASNITAFAWQGTDGGYGEPEYGSHGNGTYNINPVGGLAGLWIGETNMATTLSGYATTGAVAAVQAEVAGPWIDWSATITPINGTATVTRATGAEPMLVLTNDVVISVPTTGWPTTGVSRVSLSLKAGAHSVTLLTNTVEYSSTPTISTNDWTTILFRRTGDQAKWRGVGL